MKGFKSTGRGPTKGFRFPGGDGFSGSTGRTQTITYTRRTPQRKATGGFLPARPLSPPPTKTPMRGARVAAAPRAAVAASRPAPTIQPIRRPMGVIARAEGGKVFTGGGRPYKQHRAIRMSFAEDARNRSANRLRQTTGAQFTAREASRVAPPARIPGATSYDRVSRDSRKSLGLKKGGKPSFNRIKNLGKYAHGGKVDSALTGRSEPTNALDAVSGGKTPLRPGFSKGGKSKRMGYAKGGAVSAGEAKRIAEKTVGEHVRYPAPKGHKGQKAC